MDLHLPPLNILETKWLYNYPVLSLYIPITVIKITHTLFIKYMYIIYHDTLTLLKYVKIKIIIVKPLNALYIIFKPVIKILWNV